MSILVEKPGIFTIVQDLGRWGHQSRGVSVSEPMDPFSLRMGNAMLGNDENDAALEITMFGLEVVFQKSCCIVLTGADLNLRINGAPAEAWCVYRVEPGYRAGIAGMTGDGCRGYLCVSGGIDVAPVMGSRSTYTKARLGGFEGRTLKKDDVIKLLDPRPLWQYANGFRCPAELRVTRYRNEPIYAMDGPQADAFTEEGISTFYSEAYTVTNEIDRMGYRLDGPEIARAKSADIVSDGIVFGSVQVPGHGRPIVMMSDRQTTGGYTKIAVVSSWSVSQLSQKLPGETVRFCRVSEKEAADMLRRFENDLRTLYEMRASYRTR